MIGMIGGLGIWELVIVLVILLLIFGPSRLGDLGSSLGKGIKGFKKSMKDDEIDITPSEEEARRIEEGSEFQSPSARRSEKKEVK